MTMCQYLCVVQHNLHPVVVHCADPGNVLGEPRLELLPLLLRDQLAANADAAEVEDKDERPAVGAVERDKHDRRLNVDKQIDRLVSRDGLLEADACFAGKLVEARLGGRDKGVDGLLVAAADKVLGEPLKGLHVQDDLERLHLQAQLVLGIEICRQLVPCELEEQSVVAVALLRLDQRWHV